MNTPTCMSVFRKFISYSCLFCVLLLTFLIGGIVLASNASWFWSSSTTSNQSLSENLLAMKYNQVVYATTHNSYAVVGIIAAANQFGSIQKSLEQGVRALMLDVHFSDETKSKIALCHADCRAGTVDVEETFDTIATFLDNYPVNVITIIWETTCTDDEDCTSLKHMLYDVIGYSRLANMLYAPEHRGGPWPTLREMVHNNEKIVQFFDRGPFDRPWDLHMRQHVIETPFDNKNKNDLDAACRFGRGTPDNPEKLFLNNHFTLMGLIPVPATTVSYNTNPYMYDRIIRCQQEVGKITTNFVAVDHWSYSDVIKTVACLNREDNVQTCQSADMGRTLSTATISFIGGCIGILALYGFVGLCRILSTQKSLGAVPIKVETYPLLRDVSMDSISEL